MPLEAEDSHAENLLNEIHVLRFCKIQFCGKEIAMIAKVAEKISKAVQEFRESHRELRDDMMKNGVMQASNKLASTLADEFRQGIGQEIDNFKKEVGKEIDDLKESLKE